MKKYLIEDSKEIVLEKELRKMVLRCELNDIIDNMNEYINGELNIEYQIECIKTATNGDMNKVIEMAETNWNIPVKEMKTIDIDGFDKFLKDKYSYGNYDAFINLLNEYNDNYKEDYESEE